MAECHDENNFPHFKPLIELTCSLHCLLQKHLWVKIIIGMVLGIGTGLILSSSGMGVVSKYYAEMIACWLALPGHIFLALIQMIVIPLVIASIILGINSSQDLEYLRKIGFRIIPYFITTTTVAVLIGVLLATLIQPGKYIDQKIVKETTTFTKKDVQPKNENQQDKKFLPERIATLIPTNPMGAALNQSMLQVVIFAILVGIALVSIEELTRKPILELANSFQEVSMEIVGWAMRLAPYAVFGLLAQVTTKVGIDAIVGMSIYVGTVLLGLFLLVLFYLVIGWIIGKQSPLKFLSAIRDVQLLAFSTSSSAAVMPVSLKTAQEKLNVSPAISQFVIPLGATINMDGTALYQVIAAVFLTQVFGIEMTIAQLALLAVTTIGASIGSPSSPGVGIVILATILNQFGIPPSGIALIIGVDRILDMCRTTVNVTGDLVACKVMDSWLTSPE